MNGMIVSFGSRRSTVGAPDPKSDDPPAVSRPAEEFHRAAIAFTIFLLATPRALVAGGGMVDFAAHATFAPGYLAFFIAKTQDHKHQIDQHAFAANDNVVGKG
jgi:hypothetical protein